MSWQELAVRLSASLLVVLHFPHVEDKNEDINHTSCNNVSCVLITLNANNFKVIEWYQERAEVVF